MMMGICGICRLLPRCLLHTAPKPLCNKPGPSYQEMDFWKAADILFSEEEDPRRRKKFGWDFHLWQAFVACLPSVAIYLIAQYARREMRKIEEARDKEMAEKLRAEEKEQDEKTRRLPAFRLLQERLDEVEQKINRMESLTSQSIASATGKNGNAGDERLLQQGKAESVGDDKSSEAHSHKNGAAKEQQPTEARKDIGKVHGKQPDEGGSKADSPSDAKGTSK